jgi:DNA-binding transcriptional LysR family regulator
MNSISDLATFVEVVRAGSFVGAAQRLRMSPSGVSKKISRFENRLEVRLFNRTTRSLSLTDVGDLLFSRGCDILDSVDEAENLVKELSTNPRGTLRIAASDAFSKEILVPFLSQFIHNYPDLHTQILPADGDIDLLDNRIDVAIRFDRPTNSSFISRKLINDPWVICASPDYIKSYGMPGKPSDLKQHRTMLIRAYGRENNRWQFSEGGAISEVALEPVFSGIGLVVKEAALNNIGIARLAQFLVHSELKNNRLVPLLQDYMKADERAIHIVYPNRQYLPLKVRVFIDQLSLFISQLETKLDTHN